MLDSVNFHLKSLSFFYGLCLEMTFVISALGLYIIFLFFLLEEINLLICSLPVLLVLGLDHHRQDFSFFTVSFLFQVRTVQWWWPCDLFFFLCSCESSSLSPLKLKHTSGVLLQSFTLHPQGLLRVSAEIRHKKKNKSHLHRTSVEKCNLWNRTKKRAPSEGLALFCRKIERRTTKRRRWKSIGNRSSTSKINLLKPTHKKLGSWNMNQCAKNAVHFHHGNISWCSQGARKLSSSMFFWVKLLKSQYDTVFTTDLISLISNTVPDELQHKVQRVSSGDLTF